MNKILAYKDSGLTINIVHKNTDGSRIDITGYSFKLIVRRNETSNIDALTKTITSHSDPTQGETQIPLTPAELSGLSGIYAFWLQVKPDTNAVPRRSRNGVLEVQ